MFPKNLLLEAVFLKMPFSTTKDQEKKSYHFLGKNRVFKLLKKFGFFKFLERFKFKMFP